MWIRIALVSLTCGSLAGSVGRAEELDPAEFAGLLRSLAVNHIPSPVVKSESDWGHQTMCANGIHWERKGLIRHRPSIVTKLKNDGIWERSYVHVPDPETNLIMAVRDIRAAGDGKITFELWCGFPCQIHYDRQNWKAGVRLYGGSCRASCRVAVRLNCEATSKLETKGGFPELTFRFRVTEADLHYDQPRVDHFFGIGGDGAKLAGEMIEGFMQRRRPEFQRELLDKANAAIVKAADTDTVRLSAAKLFGGKAP